MHQGHTCFFWEECTASKYSTIPWILVYCPSQFRCRILSMNISSSEKWDVFWFVSLSHLWWQCIFHIFFSSLWPCVVFTVTDISPGNTRTLFIEWRCRIWWWCVCSCHLASCYVVPDPQLRVEDYHALEARRNPTNFLKQRKGMKPNLIYRFFFIFTYTDSNVLTPISWFLMIGTSFRSVTAGLILS